MSVSHYTILPIALLMLWVMATNTWAVDVGGTYTGTATCTRYSHDGTVTKTTRDIIALINQGVQVGGVSELNINVNFSQLGDMNGRAIADAKKPEKEGEFTAVLCSNNPNSATANAVIGAEVKQADKSTKTKLKKGSANITREDFNG